MARTNLSIWLPFTFALCSAQCTASGNEVRVHCSCHRLQLNTETTACRLFAIDASSLFTQAMFRPCLRVYIRCRSDTAPDYIAALASRTDCRTTHCHSLYRAPSKWRVIMSALCDDLAKLQVCPSLSLSPSVRH